MFLPQAQTKASRQAEGGDQQGDNWIQPPDRHRLFQRLCITGDWTEIGIDLWDHIVDAGLIGDHPLPRSLPLQLRIFDRYNGGIPVGDQSGQGGQNALFPLSGQTVPHGKQPGEGDPQVGVLNAIRGHPPELSLPTDIHHIACGENTSGRAGKGENCQQAEPDAHQGKIPRPIMSQQGRYPSTEKQRRQPQPLGDAPLQKPGAYPCLTGQEDLHAYRRRLGRIAAGPAGPLFQFPAPRWLNIQQAPSAEGCSQHTDQAEPIAVPHHFHTEQGIPDACWITGDGGKGKAQMVGKAPPENHWQKGQHRPPSADSAGE